MRIDKSKISGTRFMFSIAFYLHSSALLTSFLSGITKQESWIPIIMGVILCIPLVYMYRTIMVMFPDKNLFQVFEEVYGVVLGKIISVFYVCYFLTLSALNVTDFGDFIKNIGMVETPHMVFTICCVLVAVWAVRNGLKVVTRYSSAFAFIEFIIVGFTLILVINQINFNNFLPLFTQPLMKYIQSTHIITMIPFGELVVFLMFTPCVEKMTPKQTTKYWYKGLAMGAIVLLVVVLRDISILGNAIHLFTLPGLVTLRLVQMGNVLNRMEIIFAIAVMMLLVFKVTLLIYITTIAIAQLFNTTQYKYLALIIGVFVIFYSPTLYSNAIEHVTYARTIEPIIWTLFQIIFPLLTIILAKIRNLSEKNKSPVSIQEV